MLAEIKEQFKGRYPMGSADELEAMEQELLHFSRFDAAEALKLGVEIVEQSKKYGEDLVVRIVRPADGISVFQYAGDTCGRRNLDFACAKYHTVLKTGHCSLWALAQEETIGGVDAVFSEDSGCLPAGGAFPIYEKGKLAAVLTVSGLHEGNDYRVVVEALCSLQGKALPHFSGLII